VGKGPKGFFTNLKGGKGGTIWRYARGNTGGKSGETQRVQLIREQRFQQKGNSKKRGNGGKRKREIGGKGRGCLQGGKTSEPNGSAPSVAMYQAPSRGETRNTFNKALEKRNDLVIGKL